MLYEGERIKIFPETQVEAYKTWINDEGFACKIRRDYIEVGKRINHRKFNEVKLGILISSRRKAKGWNRYKLARSVGVHEGTVTNWEIGIREPKRETICKIMEALNITEGELEECRMKKKPLE